MFTPVSVSRFFLNWLTVDELPTASVPHVYSFFSKIIFYNNNNNNPIYKAPKALASEAVAAFQPWVLIKSFTEEVRLLMPYLTLLSSSLC